MTITLLCTSCAVEVKAQDTKRGLGAGDTFLSNSINGRWNYDWGYQKPNGLNGEYVPMFWSGGNLNTKINAIKGYGDTEYILGFNEPERADQANMTVANAISQWATITDGFAGTGIKLVSPAVSDNGNGRAWLDDFMAQVDADANLVVDEIAFHWYGTVNINNPTASANSFLSKVDQYHQDYGERNIWVTEFAGLDFGGNYTTEQMQTWNATFLQTAIAGLESRSFVTRYAWWNHNNDSRLATKDSYGLWRPTEVGDHYYPTLLSGDTRDMNGANLGLDMQYLRGGDLVNNGANLGNNALGRIYAMSNHDGSNLTSDIGGTGNFGFHGWGSVRVEENATLRKIGSNTVTMRNVDIYNDGELLVAFNGGSLVISGAGTNAQGTGSVRVGSGSNLILGDAADTNGFVLPYDMVYNGGAITVNGVGISLTGTGTITNQTNFIVNEDFVIDGSFVGNTPGLIKNGDATMTLAGNNMYAGFTNVNAGILSVTGFIGGNNVNVNNGGTLAGTGGLASAIIARNGGIVTPGITTGMLSAESADFQNGSTLVIEIASLLDFDQLSLDAALTIDSGATLEINFLAGYLPSVGDEFDILNFGSSTGMFGTVVTTATGSNIQWDFSQFQGQGIISVVSVPEPSTTGLLFLAALGNVLTRRRRPNNR